jgi:hypothetical protein
VRAALTHAQQKESAMTNTITMTGSSTGYGSPVGAELFNLSGFDNTVLLAGAADTLNIDSGQFDSIDLNSTGFSNATTDSINLGQSSFNTITSTYALYGSDVTIAGGSGPNQVSLSNDYGTTAISLGYEGNAATQAGQIPPNAVTLNGNATNIIGFQGSGDSLVNVGYAGDGLFGYSTSVALSGLLNTVIGGDENFAVSDVTGGENTIDLGNGNDIVALTGGHNNLSLGTGNSTVTLIGTHTNTAFAQGGAGSNDLVQEKGCANAVTAGDENITITGTSSSVGHLILGNGNDVLNVGGGGGTAVFGTSVANTASDQVTLGRGGAHLVFNGGQDQVLLGDQNGHGGYDKVTLNGTMLGTTLSAHGAFDKISLTHDANAAISESAVNGGLSVTIDGDAQHGMGNVTISGLATDDLARIYLSDLSPYTITSDSTPAGGVTLHFSQGSIDLIGVQAIPNNLLS